MTMHFWLGRALFILALVLFGLSGTARADHFLTHPAASVGLPTFATVVKRATEAQPQGPSIDAKALFQRGVEIKTRREAKVYITPQYTPKNVRYLKSYSVERVAKGKETAALGLLGTAAQTFRTQGEAGAAKNNVWAGWHNLRRLPFRLVPPAPTGPPASARPPGMHQGPAWRGSPTRATISLPRAQGLTQADAYRQAFTGHLGTETPTTR